MILPPLAIAERNGWEQCATNTDGTLKDAKDIDFGPDPGKPDDTPIYPPGTCYHSSFAFIFEAEMNYQDVHLVARISV